MKIRYHLDKVVCLEKMKETLCESKYFLNFLKGKKIQLLYWFLETRDVRV